MSNVDTIRCDADACNATTWLQDRWGGGPFPEGWQIGWDGRDTCPTHATEPGPPVPPEDIDPGLIGGAS